MPTVEGSHSPSPGRAPVHYRVDYDVVGHTINYRATFKSASGVSRHEGQFDFDPAHVGAKAAVDAFMKNHLAKADRDVAP